jgi:hypothetical protein
VGVDRGLSFDSEPFEPRMRAFIQRTVIEGAMPALTVIHDQEGDWLICDNVNDPNLPGASGLFHISHMLEVDSTISDTANLPEGFVARRKFKGDLWQYEAFSY